MTRDDDTPEKRPLVSSATILILSGYLVGLTVGTASTDTWASDVLACGLAGFLAFISLQLVAERKIEDAIRRERAQVSARLNRHTEVREVKLPPLPFRPESEKGDPAQVVMQAAKA
jgi:hypothetical protein